MPFPIHSILAGTLLFVLVISSPFEYVTAAEVIEIQLRDGETTKGKLVLPEAGSTIHTLVVYVHGTGPNTYENPREVAGKSFKYYDMLSEEFARRGIAAFAFNRRGVRIGTDPPNFDRVDRDKYRKGVPSVEVDDFETILASLRERPELKQAKIVLLGFSEGTIIASLVAEREANEISALLLAGYAHENLFEIIQWQFSGASSMINLRPPFDANKNGAIERSEYESDSAVPTHWREKIMQGADFDTLDKNKDQSLTADDFRVAVESTYQKLLSKIKERDEDWIWENYFRVSIPWLEEHFQLESNKDRLLRLKMPIYVFHGDRDANVDVAGVHDLKRRFESAGKSNLHALVFEGHDHQLNFFDWIFKKQMSKGYLKIFEVASQLNQQFESEASTAKR